MGPGLPGQDSYPGYIEHSANYKSAGQFRNQTVVVLGSGESGEDIARDLSSSVTKAYLVGKKARCNRSRRVIGERKNVHRRNEQQIFMLNEDGTVVLTPSGEILRGVDGILLCTGYAFSYPFLEAELEKGLDIDQNKLSPLYHKLFYAYDPTLVFIGVPLKVVPFPLMEL